MDKQLLFAQAAVAMAEIDYELNAWRKAVYQVVICKVKDLVIGDTLVTWGEKPEGLGEVVWIDLSNHEYAVVWDDPLQHVDGAVTKQWYSPHNNVKRLRRDGEVFDWERMLAVELPTKTL